MAFTNPRHALDFEGLLLDAREEIIFDQLESHGGVSLPEVSHSTPELSSGSSDSIKSWVNDIETATDLSRSTPKLTICVREIAQTLPSGSKRAMLPLNGVVPSMSWFTSGMASTTLLIVDADFTPGSAKSVISHGDYSTTSSGTARAPSMNELLSHKGKAVQQPASRTTSAGSYNPPHLQPKGTRHASISTNGTFDSNDVGPAPPSTPGFSRAQSPAPSESASNMADALAVRETSMADRIHAMTFIEPGEQNAHVSRSVIHGSSIPPSHNFSCFSASIGRETPHLLPTGPLGVPQPFTHLMAREFLFIPESSVPTHRHIATDLEKHLCPGGQCLPEVVLHPNYGLGWHLHIDSDVLRTQNATKNDEQADWPDHMKTPDKTEHGCIFQIMRNVQGLSRHGMRVGSRKSGGTTYWLVVYRHMPQCGIMELEIDGTEGWWWAKKGVRWMPLSWGMTE